MALLRRNSWAFCLLALAGCWGQGSTEKNLDRVAIVDLDEVSRRIGRDTVMGNSVAVQTQSLNSQLRELQQNLKASLDKKSNQVARPNSKLSPQQNQVSDENELQQLRLAANQRLNRAQQKAQKVISSHRMALIRKFRKEAMDFVREIARERNIKIVLTNNDSVVFLFESPVDLTKEVAKRMLANAPTHQLSGLPQKARPTTAADQGKRLGGNLLLFCFP